MGASTNQQQIQCHPAYLALPFPHDDGLGTFRDLPTCFENGHPTATCQAQTSRSRVGCWLWYWTSWIEAWPKIFEGEFVSRFVVLQKAVFFFNVLMSGGFSEECRLGRCRSLALRGCATDAPCVPGGGGGQ